ncbi:MAG: phosphopantetheine-binding protein [Betaproteobacteria bacterium]
MTVDSATRHEIIRHLLDASDTKLTAAQITEATTLRDDLGITSMVLIGLALDLQDALKINIEDDELIKIKTVGDLFGVIAQMQKQG